MKNIYLLIISILMFNQTFAFDYCKKAVASLLTKEKELFIQVISNGRLTGRNYSVLIKKSDTTSDIIRKINEKYKLTEEITDLKIVTMDCTDNMITEQKALLADTKVTDSGIWDLNKSNRDGFTKRYVSIPFFDEEIELADV